jgi:hypothetical protein
VKITPRKAEVQQIVSLLESDGYENAEALAKDVLKEAAAIFAGREWHAYAWRTGPGAPVLAWGPLSSPTEVKKFAEKAALGGEHLCVKLFSTTVMLDRIASAEKGKSKHCSLCTHPLGAHEHRGGCAVGGCSCTEPTP